LPAAVGEGATDVRIDHRGWERLGARADALGRAEVEHNARNNRMRAI
jgi:hypothetical protein